MNNTAKNKNRIILWYGVFLIALIVLIYLSIRTGSLAVTFRELFVGMFDTSNQQIQTILDLRMPRILISLIGGAALAVSGTLMQAVLKNPLADPGILGIASGANFGTVLITVVFPGLYFMAPVFAILGGIVACILVSALSWDQGFKPLRILLVGISVEAVFTGFIKMLQTFGSSNLSGAASILEGNITLKTWQDVRTMALYCGLVLFVAFFVVKPCDLLSLEDKTARGIGFPIHRYRGIITFIAVLLTSVTTAIIGSIGFLGLIAPHIGRLLVGSKHRVLLPFTMILGADILLLADTLGRSILAPYEINASVLLAILGGPFFIFLLRRNQKTYGNA